MQFLVQLNHLALQRRYLGFLLRYLLFQDIARKLNRGKLLVVHVEQLQERDAVISAICSRRDRLTSVTPVSIFDIAGIEIPRRVATSSSVHPLR